MREQGRKSDFKLRTFDDIFSTQEMRDEETGAVSKVQDIPIDKIDPFEGHPFKVIDDFSMMQLVESIKEHGVITPAVVTKKDDGRYELVSGHRRKRASEIAGLDTLRCEVVELTRDEAVIQMVESNFQRESLLPSEKAFAYKMRYDTMKAQRQKSKKGVTTAQELGSEMGESEKQIRRYIRLTYLAPELLEMVDAGVVKLVPAVELSYLRENEQRYLATLIDDLKCTPSHGQAIRMKELSKKGELSDSVMDEIMFEKKPNQKAQVRLSRDKIRMIVPKSVPDDELEKFAYKAIEHYAAYLRKKTDIMR